MSHPGGSGTGLFEEVVWIVWSSLEWILISDLKIQKRIISQYLVEFDHKGPQLEDRKFPVSGTFYHIILYNYYTAIIEMALWTIKTHYALKLYQASKQWYLFVRLFTYIISTVLYVYNILRQLQRKNHFHKHFYNKMYSVWVWSQTLTKTDRKFPISGTSMCVYIIQKAHYGM